MNEVQIVKGQKMELHRINEVKSNVIIIVRLQQYMTRSVHCQD